MLKNDREPRSWARKSQIETIGAHSRRVDKGLKRNLLARRAAIPCSTLIGYEGGRMSPR